MFLDHKLNSHYKVVTAPLLQISIPQVKTKKEKPLIFNSSYML